MDRKRKSRPALPDGQPKLPSDDHDSTGKSTVSEVQDPEISGDTAKPESGRSAGETTVDEAGQIRKKDPPVDFLH